MRDDEREASPVEAAEWFLEMYAEDCRLAAFLGEDVGGLAPKFVQLYGRLREMVALAAQAGRTIEAQAQRIEELEGW